MTGESSSLIARFLGQDKAAGGPFALLGLDARLGSSLTNEHIAAALEHALGVVDGSNEADTPEADEVRLALHAAAAQLFDPKVRRHMIARWGQAGATRRPASASSPSIVPRLSDGSALALEHDAILTLAMYGGWNKRSLRRLVTLAHARGIPNNEIAQTLQHLSTRRSRKSSPPKTTGSTPTQQIAQPATTSTAQYDKPLPEQIDPARRVLKLLGVVFVVGFIAAVLTLAVVWYIVFNDQTATPTSPADIANAPGPIVSPPPPPDAETAPPEQPTSAEQQASAEQQPQTPIDPSWLRRELAACTAGLEVDPNDALARFDAVIAAISHNWCDFPPDQLIAVHHAVIEFVYRCPVRGGVSARAAGAIAAGADPIAKPDAPFGTDQVWPSAWSAGMLTRLSRERDLPAVVERVVGDRLAEALPKTRIGLDATFTSGVVAVLGVLPDRLMLLDGEESSEGWARWSAAVAAVAHDDDELRNRLLLSGLEKVLLGEAEPDQDRDVFNAIELLVTKVDWDGDLSRRWLLQWFRDPGVSSADLNAITSALVTRVGPEKSGGADLTMVLAPRATDRDRALMRDDYATLWAMVDGADRDQIEQDWIDEARAAISASEGDLTITEAMTALARLSLLNEAASWHWRGESDEANNALIRLAELDTRLADDPIFDPSTDTGSTAFLRNDKTDDWGESYLVAQRNIPIRKDLLDDLADGRYQLGPVGADALAIEATRGSPLEVRRKAQEVVRGLANDPAVVNALLEALPRAPRVKANSFLIADVAQRRLPPVKDATWPIAARRALVERLLELVASGGDLAIVDELSQPVAEAYWSRASRTPLNARDRVSDAPPASSSVTRLWNRWRRAAEGVVPNDRVPITLDRIDRLRAGRVRLASGLVQRFAADQFSICDAMAYVISAEQPALAGRAGVVLDELRDVRRTSGHVILQVAATERAMTRLWLLRFEEEPR